MRVLFVVENYYPHIGGVEAVFKNLAEGLAKEGHEIVVITHRLRKTKKQEVMNGVRIRRISCFGSRYLFSFAAIPRTLQLARKSDIIHTTTFNGTLPAWIAARLTGKKVVITVHEVWIGMWKQLADMSLIGKLLHDLAERIIYLLPYDFYVAVSESTRKQLLRIRIPSQKVRTIYNAINYEHFNTKKYNGEKIRKKHKLAKDFVYLTYGRPGISKGIEYVVRAVPQISKKIPNSKLMLILSTDPAYAKQYGKIVRLIRTLGIKEHVLLLPPVAYEEIPSYLKAANCVVVPSLAEGFGYTVAEAVSMNVPVIATNTTSLPEVVSGKHLLVQPRSSKQIAEAVVKVSKGKYDVSKRKTFSLKKNINGYLSVYHTLLKKI